MIPSAIWTLIGVVVGAYLVYRLNLRKDHIKEEQRRREYLKDLFSELEYNKRLSDENKKEGYDTSAYTDAKEAKYLLVLPKELRYKINDAQNMLINARLRDGLYYVERIDIERLKELLENIIPEFERYLKK